MLIRDITPADLSRVLEINEANVPEVGSIDADRLAFLVAESAIALVVEADAPVERQLDSEVVGFCVVLAPGSSYDSVNYVWFMDRYDDALYLDRVAFDASARGLGFGQALYAAVDSRMRSDHPDHRAITLEVNLDPPNEPSLRFHDRQGFVEVGRQLSKGIEVSLMRKELSKGV